MMRGTTKRRFRTVPMGSKGVFFDLEVQRVGCLRCGSIRQVSLGFADPRFSYTNAFERYALDEEIFQALPEGSANDCHR